MKKHNKKANQSKAKQSKPKQSKPKQSKPIIKLKKSLLPLLVFIRFPATESVFKITAREFTVLKILEKLNNIRFYIIIIE